MVAQSKGGEGKPRRTRRHKPQQLIARPLTLESCAGPVLISAEIRNGQQWVNVSYPADVPVSQPAKAEESERGDCYDKDRP